MLLWSLQEDRYPLAYTDTFFLLHAISLWGQELIRMRGQSGHPLNWVSEWVILRSGNIGSRGFSRRVKILAVRPRNPIVWKSNYQIKAQIQPTNCRCSHDDIVCDSTQPEKKSKHPEKQDNDYDWVPWCERTRLWDHLKYIQCNTIIQLICDIAILPKARNA